MFAHLDRGELDQPELRPRPLRKSAPHPYRSVVESIAATADAQPFSRTGVGDAVPLQLALEGARPNPARGAIQAWFTLPNREPAMLDLIDVAGRRVLRRNVGALGPGRHVVALGTSPGLRPGLYFMRLAQRGRVFNARVVMMR